MSPGRNGLDRKNRCLLFWEKKRTVPQEPLIRCVMRMGSDLGSIPALPGTSDSPHEREPIGPTTYQAAACTP